MPVLNIAKYMGGGSEKIVPVIFIFWILMWMFYFSVLFLEDPENLSELRELSSDVVNWTHTAYLHCFILISEIILFLSRKTSDAGG